MNTYRVIMKNDNGTIVINIEACDREEASKRACTIENAPVSAIQSIIRLVAIESLTKEDLFKFPGGKNIYVFEGYDRGLKRYTYSKFNDVNDFSGKKKGTMVEIDFDF